MEKLVVITAPSGAGKTTIAKALLRDLQLMFSVSATSRKKRLDEIHGRDYFFIESVQAFHNLVEQDAFIEWEEVYPDAFYGTLRSEVSRIHELGKTILFDVDVKGALKLKNMFEGNALTLFIKPPAPELLILEERIKKRPDSTLTLEERIERLSKAPEELATADLFDQIIINDDLQVAIEQSKKYVQEFLAV